MKNVVPLHSGERGREASVRGTINARAAHLKVCDAIRRKWIGKAFAALKQGACTGWAISEAVRGMTSEHLAAKAAAPSGDGNGEEGGDVA